MLITDTPENIMAHVRQSAPEVDGVMKRVRERVAFYKREIALYQGYVLYALTKQYNREGARILELGTAFGFTAAIMAEAAPLAKIETLNPKVAELAVAAKNLFHYPNIALLPLLSWDYLADYNGPQLDLIFVDGDHKRIALDLPWWKHVTPGGLMCFHDYSPADSGRPCPPVYEALNAWADQMGKPLDVRVVDNANVGFAGMYKT